MKTLLFITISIIMISCSDQKEEYKFQRAVSGSEFRAIDLAENKMINIKIFGIQSPEYGECFSVPAQVYLDSLLSGKTLTIEVKENADQYISAVVFDNEKSIAYKILAAGMAKVIPADSIPSNYNVVEGIAREESLGLWACE